MNEFICNLPSNELMNYILATIVRAVLKIDIGRFGKLYLLALCYLNDARIINHRHTYCRDVISLS